MSLKFSFNGNLLADTHQLGPEDRFSYEAAEQDIEITGIIYRTDEIDYLAGSDQYALIIEGNPLLQGNHEAVLTALLLKLGGFRYRPFKFEVLSYPHLWPGDKITKLIEPDGSELQSIITNHLFKLNGNSTLEARGETETVRGYATGAPFTPSQKRVLQAVAKIEAARQTSALEQAVLQLNELMMNSLGFYSTTVELETGAKITYTHDQPSLEESMIIWTMTEQGFAWTDQGWQGGNPAWQYGVTADGSIVARLLDVIGIRAEWIQVGSAGDYISGEIDEAKDYAAAEAELKAAEAQAAAEQAAAGMVSAETQARIDQAEANLAAAKTHAEQKAAEAKQGAKDYASQILKNLADGNYPDGTFISGNLLYSPEIHAAKVFGLSGTFTDMLIGNPEGSRLQISPTEPREPYSLISGWGKEGAARLGAKVGMPIASNWVEGDEPFGAFDGILETYWASSMVAVLGVGPWIGLDYTNWGAHCVKRVEGRIGGDRPIILEYYDEHARQWVTTDELDWPMSWEHEWHEADVNADGVFAFKWRIRFPESTIGAANEIEFYGVPYRPFIVGFNRDNERVYEFADKGITIFGDRFYMDNKKAAVIIDQGSNDNGYWAKWSNGLQICWIPSITLSYFHSGMLRGHWTYPVGFISNPVGSTNPAEFSPSADGREISEVITCGTTSAAISASARSSAGYTAGDTWVFQAIVVGWWK